MIESYKRGWTNCFNLDKKITKNEFFAFLFSDLIVVGIFGAVMSIFAINNLYNDPKYMFITNPILILFWLYFFWWNYT